MATLPTGTVTFLFTDVEGSTRLWERHPEQMWEALAEHDALIEFLTEQHEGQIVRPRGEGDSRFCVFARASDAAAAAAAIQRGLSETSWPAETPLRVRMALHTGEADLRDGDYYGSAVNRAARLRSIAHGGQTVLSQATYDLVQDSLPHGVTLHDLGERRLSDLARPEHVFQLMAPGMPADFPPLRSLDTQPHNLPLQLTSFIGRERELVTVREVLATHRLVTLTGPGGTGKTRLALQVAADVLPAYPDGVWLVELAALTDPGLVPQAVAASVGVQEEPGRPLVATLADTLKPKRVFLLLDNCEHLLDACARLADVLLRACPTLTMLATSREALGIAGETAWRVPSLSLPETGHLSGAGALRQYEAVRLFIDRAAAVLPGFQVTDRNALAIAQICQRLDGIPLAIELAAARARVLPPEQLLARLEDRFRLLTGGSRTALERHQTLQAAVDWSYDLLSDQEKTLFTRLSVFAGGWTLEAAEGVCAGEGIDAAEVLDLLARMVEKSLVLMDEQPDGTARYRLLETIREYALERQGEDGQADSLGQRHAAHFAALATQAETAMRGPQQVTWLERLAQDHDNLRAALAWWLSHDEGQQAVRLAGALWRFWQLRGHYQEGRDRLGAALALSRATAPEGAGAAARAEALFGAWTIAWLRGDVDECRALAQEALALGQALGDDDTVAWAYFQIAGMATVNGDLAAARPALEQSLAMQRALGNRNAAAWPMTYLGEVAVAEGDLDAARRLLYESRHLFREQGEQFGLGGTLYRLGDLALAEGDHRGAHAYYAESLRLLGALGDRAWLPSVLERVARLATVEGEPARALRLAGAASGLRASSRAAALPYWQNLVEQWLAPARAPLSQKQAEAALAEGQAMSLEQAIAYALDDMPEGTEQLRMKTLFARRNNAGTAPSRPG